ncbi:hypothetical protein AB1Y20_010438 [Prymnesium parvum]|uniref:Homeobox domain-containing protein n=1 Tax=Prymnesium parvum TaxID=97485 RepID=A0AB34IRF0_PRYPA
MKSAEEDSVHGGGACSRWKISSESKGLLEREFHRKRFPSPRSKKRLADELDVEPRRIQVWFQNRRQREKTGPDPELPRPPVKKSGLERYPETHGGYGTGYGTPATYLSPMLREPSFHEAKDEMLTIPDGGVSRLAHVRHRRMESDMHSDFSSEWGDSITSQACHDAFGAMADEDHLRLGGMRAHSPCRSEHVGTGDALGVNSSTLAGMLSSSDDIVHALMEFEGAPSAFHNCDDLTRELWEREDVNMPRHLAGRSDGYLMSMGDFSQHDLKGGNGVGLGAHECDFGNYYTKPSVVPAVAPGVTTPEDAAEALHAAANADYANSHLQSILSAGWREHPDWRGRCIPPDDRYDGNASGNDSWSAPGPSSLRQHVEEVQSRMMLPGCGLTRSQPITQAPPRDNTPQPLPAREESTKDMGSWIHAADMVNAVLSTARQQYAVATGRHTTSDRRVQPEMSSLPHSFDSWPYSHQVPNAPMPQMRQSCPQGSQMDWHRGND